MRKKFYLKGLVDLLTHVEGYISKYINKVPEAMETTLEGCRAQVRSTISVIRQYQEGSPEDD